ncbi:TIGR01906 family membrane protein [Lapidilactobacillus mulanensis]|uniref:TIGR01906 family membrane protein n=1 Tax=Lapidilactobacillus mulanensis TaxID=2485999 RepID=A0ABW4DLU6_9LACO|nr:TIGR01906 family membrane protein [Lapidilactobacillus mulanensis]
MIKERFKNGGNWVTLVGFCISLAVVLTLLLSYALFPIDAAFYQVRHLYPISAGALYQNYVELMTYLQFPWIDKLVLTNFPVSASGALHFADVKKLFILAWLLLIVTAPFAIRFLHRLKVKKQNYRLLWAAQVGLVVPIVIALVASINFDQFFVTFHQLFFRNQDWLFDPATDPIILVLPEEFFMHCFILAFVLFEGMMLIGIIKARRSLKQLR